ncbi:hypothetical protein OHC33_011174 [Knufia fluminis]|uniref:Uncharacterized protein n=1 Tax=Knufia fluminis TaxID=191047 RepID=A0AAN8E7G1_9EURO|nr:hypothetical protein OHC33_011174 [Knufia fluminis]
MTSLVSRDEAQDLDFDLFRTLEHITLRPHPTRWLLRTQFQSKTEEIRLGEFQCVMDEEARGFYDTLKDTTQEFYGLKTAFRKGVLVTLIRELEVNTDTVYRSWHQVSKEGPKVLSAKNFVCCRGRRRTRRQAEEKRGSTGD